MTFPVSGSASTAAIRAAPNEASAWGSVSSKRWFSHTMARSKQLPIRAAARCFLCICRWSPQLNLQPFKFVMFRKAPGNAFALLGDWRGVNFCPCTVASARIGSEGIRQKKSGVSLSFGSKHSHSCHEDHERHDARSARSRGRFPTAQNQKDSHSTQSLSHGRRHTRYTGDFVVPQKFSGGENRLCRVADIQTAFRELADRSSLRNVQKFSSRRLVLSDAAEKNPRDKIRPGLRCEWFQRRVRFRHRRFVRRPLARRRAREVGSLVQCSAGSPGCEE